MSAESIEGTTLMRRLHPLSVVFGIGVAARRLLLPGLFVVFFRPGGQSELWLMLLFIPAVVAALARYFSYRYLPGTDELIVREGIVTRNERHIPYARIQNIDLVQNVVHRLFGVAEVRIETASGDRPEAVMRVLSLGAIDTLRKQVFRERTPDGVADLPSPRQPDPPLVQVGISDLVLVGLTTHRGLALIAATMGALWQIDPLDDIDQNWIEERIGTFDLPAALTVPGPWATALLAIGTVTLILLLLTALSIAWATLRYYGFTLRVRGDDIRAEYGLLTRITATIPRHRIQQLSTLRGPIHRLAGRTSIQVETAGHSQGEEGTGVDRLWLAPMIVDREVADLIRTVMPDVDPERLEWQPIATRAWKRIVKRGIFAAIVVSVGAGVALGPWALLVLGAGSLLAGLHAHLYVRYASYALAPNAIVYRSGWWNRKMSIVRYAKIQALAMEATPFDRWNRMASVHVDTAGAGRVGHGVDIRYLEQDAACGVMSRLAMETGRRSFRW